MTRSSRVLLREKNVLLLSAYSCNIFPFLQHLYSFQLITCFKSEEYASIQYQQCLQIFSQRCNLSLEHHIPPPCLAHICCHTSASACKGCRYYVGPPRPTTRCDLSTGDRHTSVMTFPLTRVAVGPVKEVRLRRSK